MSDSLRPRRRQPTRLPRPWDSPGKNTGVGCHFLLQCMKVKTESEVAQSCPTRRDPRGLQAPGSCPHGIFQARVLEWGAIAFCIGRFISLCLPLSRAPQVVLVVKNLPANAEDIKDASYPWVEKFPWRRAWQPTKVFLPGESHGQRSLGGYSPRGRKELDVTEMP